MNEASVNLKVAGVSPALTHPVSTKTLCAGGVVGVGTGCCCCAVGAATHQVAAMTLPRTVFFMCVTLTSPSISVGYRVPALHA